jgi:hypothetical protein
MPEEYLDIQQLAERIPFSVRSIETAIQEGYLVKGVHFYQPMGPKGKRVFFMSAIEKWLKGQDFTLRRDALKRAG